MEITVLSFGQIADLTGPTLEIRDASDTDTLEALLRQRFPGLRGMSYVVAVDKKTIRENTPLHSSSVVALLPPFSGG
jgi:molybdopterin synthase sulfur carrier subunit